LLQLEPLFDEACHCTVGDGLPEAEALKAAVDPEVTVVLEGWPVMTGAAVTGWVLGGVVETGFTWRVATRVVAEPMELVKTARY
jgi:hypothetical protein